MCYVQCICIYLGCEVDCPFPQFITLLSDMTVKDIKTECQVDSSQPADESIPKPDSGKSCVIYNTGSLILCQNNWANFNQPWHKISFGEGKSNLFK